MAEHSRARAQAAYVHSAVDLEPPARVQAPARERRPDAKGHQPHEGHDHHLAMHPGQVTPVRSRRAFGRAGLLQQVPAASRVCRSAPWVQAAARAAWPAVPRTGALEA